MSKPLCELKERTMDFGYNPNDWAMSKPALAKLLAKWKKERGYDPIKNPGARYHINDPVLREFRKVKK